MDLQVIEIFFAVGIRDDHKQVESIATGNTSEQSETFLTMFAAEHQGRFT